MISKSATAENNSSTKSLDCFVANTFFPFNNLNPFKSGNSTLRFGLTENPVNSSTFLEISGNISLENDSNDINSFGNSESSSIFSDNFAISFSSSISTEI